MAAAPRTRRQRRQAVVAVRDGGRGHARRIWTHLVGCVVVAALTSCSGEGTAAQPTRSTTPSPTSSPSAAAVDEETALLAQYRKFWAALTPVSRMPAAQRRDVLAEVAVNPALKSVLAGMEEADAKHQVLYGENVPRPTVRIAPDATTALVRDCQDSSHAGVAERSTEKQLTVGVARNHVSVTMKRQPGDVWKIAYIDYARSPC